MVSSERYVEIAVPGPVRRTFTYRLPTDIQGLASGQRLLVPFGRVRKVGYFIGASAQPENVRVKDVIRPVDESSLFPPELFRLCQWMAEYYFGNVADCLLAALPPALKGGVTPAYFWGDQISEQWPERIRSAFKAGKRMSSQLVASIKNSERGLMNKLISSGAIIQRWPEAEAGAKKKVSGYRLAEGADLGRIFGDDGGAQRVFAGSRSRAKLIESGWTSHFVAKAIKAGMLEPCYDELPGNVLDFVKPKADVDCLVLNDEQQVVFERMKAAQTEGFKVFLLHGITGSGKTLVYCHLTREVLAKGRTVLCLTPEISLTGATLTYFRGFFGEQVTVVHSAMTSRERLQSWRGVREGRYRIVIGPRSAIFAPLENLGLIIVDEEHDSSFKQDDPSPRFHGRDSAIMRGKIAGVPVLLGSATPSIESYYHATQGRYELLQLTKRPGEASLPTVRLVDMRTERVGGDLQFVSITLKNQVEDRLKKGEQVILYLNRRGYAPQVKCADCGYVPQCPHCMIRMTYHKVERRLTCHYCGHSSAAYDACEKCHGTRLMYVGAGTQKVEESLPRLFELAKPLRMDSDAAAGREGVYRILSEFASRKFNLLLGTQMVTKGLDLPGVSLVGVLSADIGADLPDFRASEKTLAKLVQVAGRTGRADRKGEVLIQTFAPDSELIADAARQDYRGFYEREIASREAGQFPPFVRLVNVLILGPDEKKVDEASLQLRDNLRAEIESAKISARVLGPAPCPLYRLRKQYRRHLLIKTTQAVKLIRMLSNWELRSVHFGMPRAIKIVVDVDPDDMM